MVGDRVPNFADMDAFERDTLLDEIEANGLVINRRGRIGSVALCEECAGHGLDDRGHECEACQKSGYEVDYGDGKEPYDE